MQEYSTANSSVQVANMLLVPQQESNNHAIQEYKQTALSLFQAETYDVDFVNQQQEILAQVNSWVKGKTRGLIDKILNEPLSPNTAAVILNAIYFKGKWVKPFDRRFNTKTDFFNHGQTATVTEFMTQKRTFYDYADVQINGEQPVQVLQLPYQENNMSMLIVLPRDRDGLRRILSSTENMAALSSSLDTLTLSSAYVNVLLPKFTLEAEYDLPKALKALGMRDAFNGSKADFSGINGRRDIFVSDVKHKAYVKVDEVGTEAAAVTAIITRFTMSAIVGPDPINFTADHPFLFLIKDNTHDLILFMGMVEQL